MKHDPGETVIDIRGLSYSRCGRWILEDVNLAVRAKEMVAVVGPNGGGKTTLLRLILGRLQPQQGCITVFGKRPDLVSHRIGYVPQQVLFDADFPVTALDVALMGRAGRSRLGPYRRADRQAARQALEMVGLAQEADCPFARLSGGQRQRVLIARALAGAPELLLLDEPTANVDAHSGEILYDILFHLNQDMAVVVVSHDMSFVARRVDSVVCVNRRVNIHPVSELSGNALISLYGRDLSLIRHDHRCSAEGHQCPDS